MLVLASQLEVLGDGALGDYPRTATRGECGARATAEVVQLNSLRHRQRRLPTPEHHLLVIA